MKLIGRVTLAGQALLCFATYTLVRIGGLWGRWDAKPAKAPTGTCPDRHVAPGA
ncbi:hypothetical protein [Immundisolibacter sp.]